MRRCATEECLMNTVNPNVPTRKRMRLDMVAAQVSLNDIMPNRGITATMAMAVTGTGRQPVAQ